MQCVIGRNKRSFLIKKIYRENVNFNLWTNFVHTSNNLWAQDKNEYLMTFKGLKSELNDVLKHWTYTYKVYLGLLNYYWTLSLNRNRAKLKNINLDWIKLNLFYDFFSFNLRLQIGYKYCHCWNHLVCKGPSCMKVFL